MDQNSCDFVWIKYTFGFHTGIGDIGEIPSYRVGWYDTHEDSEYSPPTLAGFLRSPFSSHIRVSVWLKEHDCELAEETARKALDEYFIGLHL